jgi:hypothetical protein
MPWDYPKVFCLGLETGTLPDFIWGGVLPVTIPGVGGDHGMVFPSSCGGDNQYWNVFAVATGSIVTSLPTPFYIWFFGLSAQCTDPLTVPSNYSIYEYVWNCRPERVTDQYLLISADEYDCSGTVAGNVGNKMGRNYSIIGDYDNGYYWGWGSSIELGMCLAVCDIVTIPVNTPGNPGPLNPYNGTNNVNGQFDVGIATVTPFASSGCASLRFMTLANQSAGYARAVLGAFGSLDGFFFPAGPIIPNVWMWPGPGICQGPWNNCIPYGALGWRVPHTWDAITGLMFKIVLVFAHIPMPDYPGYMFASHAGIDTIPLTLPPDPLLLCTELRWSSLQFPIKGFPLFPDQPGGPPSASFMATYN